MAAPRLKGFVCVIGLSQCFISGAQNGRGKSAAQALVIQQKPFLLVMCGSGVLSFTVCTLDAVALNNRSPLMWFCLQPEGLFIIYSIFFSPISVDLLPNLMEATDKNVRI